MKVKWLWVMNITVILVTHNLLQARRVADQVYFMWDGKIIEDDPPGDIREPQDISTRLFLVSDAVF